MDKRDVEKVRFIGDEICEDCGPLSDCDINPEDCEGLQNAVKMLNYQYKETHVLKAEISKDGATMSLVQELVISEDDFCKLCKGYGKIVTSTVRQIGYTFSLGELKSSVEEQIIPCPKCKGEVLKKVKCEGVGDNDGFFETEI